MRPKDLGISPFFTLDETSKLESVFLLMHPEQNNGDSGSSTPTNKSHKVPHSAPGKPTILTSILHAIPEEIVNRRSLEIEIDANEDELYFDDEEKAFENRTLT